MRDWSRRAWLRGAIALPFAGFLARTPRPWTVSELVNPTIWHGEVSGFQRVIIVVGNRAGDVRAWMHEIPTGVWRACSRSERARIVESLRAWARSGALPSHRGRIALRWLETKHDPGVAQSLDVMRRGGRR